MQFQKFTQNNFILGDYFPNKTSFKVSKSNRSLKNFKSEDTSNTHIPRYTKSRQYNEVISTFFKKLDIFYDEFCAFDEDLNKFYDSKKNYHFSEYPLGYEIHKIQNYIARKMIVSDELIKKLKTDKEKIKDNFFFKVNNYISRNCYQKDIMQSIIKKLIYETYNNKLFTPLVNEYKS
jgi:hypothetical protein